MVASERPVIQTTFNLTKDDVHELEPGQALIVKKNGKISLSQIIEKKEKIKMHVRHCDVLHNLECEKEGYTVEKGYDCK